MTSSHDAMQRPEAQLSIPEIVIEASEPAAATSLSAFIRSSLSLGSTATSLDLRQRSADNQVDEHSSANCLQTGGLSGPLSQSVGDLQQATSTFDDDDDDSDSDNSSEHSYSSQLESHSVVRGRLDRLLSKFLINRASEKTAQSRPEFSRQVSVESSLSVHGSTCQRCRRAASSMLVKANDSKRDGNVGRAVQRLTSSLRMSELHDGKFTARLPVDQMPSGDVMIRMRSSRLEVLRSRRMYGVIDLPMYVDTSAVIVRYDALQQCLIIEARTKGGLRRRSLSLDDLWFTESKSIRHIGARLKQHQHVDHVVLFTDTPGTGSVDRDQ